MLGHWGSWGGGHLGGAPDVDGDAADASKLTKVPAKLHEKSIAVARQARPGQGGVTSCVMEDARLPRPWQAHPGQGGMTS